MKIAVIGAGAIGGLSAGYLKLKGEDVSLIGHADSVRAIREKGLEISGVRGNSNIKIDISEKLNSPVDLVILATKTQDIYAAIEDNRAFLNGAAILTTQNGVRADEMLTKYIPKENIVSSIVMFGATYLEPGRVVHNFEGSWVIGRIFAENDGNVAQITRILKQAFTATAVENIKGMKYLKIFLNANNCIPAILGVSMQEAFSDINISCISIAIWKEGLEIINKAGINLVSLPDFPAERIGKLTSLPQIEAAKIFLGMMMNLSQEPLYGSILQSIKRNRPSEINFINGEFIKLAKEHSLKAPLNEKLVEMVYQVEAAGKFFNKEELLKGTESLLY